MANPKGTLKTLRPYKKGVSGNPKGRPAVPADIKAMREFNASEFERVFNKFIFMNQDELTAATKRKDFNVLEMMVLSIMQKAVKEGDQKRMNFLLDRMVGPVVRKVDHTSDGKALFDGGVTSEEREARINLLKKITKVLEERNYGSEFKFRPGETPGEPREVTPIDAGPAAAGAGDGGAREEPPASGRGEADVGKAKG